MEGCRASLWLVVAAVLVVIFGIGSVNASCFPALFNFGDSQSDTGGIQASFPRVTPAEYPPYGSTFFEAPQNRYCDGRLLIDFIAEGLGLPFLDPYLQSVTSDFTHGANFATAGATVQQVTYLSPFTLGVQTQHFLLFRRGVEAMRNRDHWTWARTSTNVKTSSSVHEERVNRLPEMEYFSRALYTWCIGGNDYTWGYTNGKTTEQVKEYLPEVVKGLIDSIKSVHDEGGGRNFVVFDMEPQGCLPYMKTLIQHSPEDLDERDCLPPYNEAARFLNSLLNDSLADLRAQWPDSKVIFLSTYDMKMDIIRNPEAAGFKMVRKACCGVPNEYHYDLSVACGQGFEVNGVFLKSEKCDDPNEYVVWDGVHTTEAANRYQAKKIFSGQYFYPDFPELTRDCDLTPIT